MPDDGPRMVGPQGGFLCFKSQEPLFSKMGDGEGSIGWLARCEKMAALLATASFSLRPAAAYLISES